MDFGDGMMLNGTGSVDPCMMYSMYNLERTNFHSMSWSVYKHALNRFSTNSSLLASQRRTSHSERGSRSNAIKVAIYVLVWFPRLCISDEVLIRIICWSLWRYRVFPQISNYVRHSNLRQVKVRCDQGSYYRRWAYWAFLMMDIFPSLFTPRVHGCTQADSLWTDCSVTLAKFHGLGVLQTVTKHQKYRAETSARVLSNRFINMLSTRRLDHINES